MTTGGIILLVLFTFGAAFVQRVTGFGFGIFIMTMLPHLMPSYGEATALSGLLALVSVSLTAWNMRKSVSWKKLWMILLTFIAVSFFSVMIVSKVDGYLLKKILGVMLILASIYFFFVSGKIKMKPDAATQISMGTISGMMGGLFAMQGPPAVIYFMSCTDDKNEYMALTTWYFVIGNLCMTLFRAGNGFVTATVLQSCLIGIPALVVGVLIGKIVYNRIPINLLRRIVYGYMAFSGIIALM